MQQQILTKISPHIDSVLMVRAIVIMECKRIVVIKIVASIRRKQA